ncbi:MAG TPA: hypothetical protein VMJ10_30335 [Kofleriaceae bacterium]|nr:hypothetical protein [Kofleriaceae bacterium]
MVGVRAILVVTCALAGCPFEHGVVGQTTGDAGTSHADASGADGHGGLDGRQFLDAPVQGSLVVTHDTLGDGDTTLSTEGTADWAHWGMSSATTFDHAASGGKISDITVVGSSFQTRVYNISVTASWTNGTPDATASQIGTGTGTNSPGALVLTVPAGVASHTLKMYVGGRASHGQLDLTLSDASAGPYSNADYSGGGAYHAYYTIVYNAASDGQTLNVSWSDLGDTTATNDYVMIMSATLQ